MLEILVGCAAILAGAVASVAGFGIGSILTPLLSVEVGTRAAVAAISIPHFVGTLTRFLLLRGRADKRVLAHFGFLSAAGGLAGSLLHAVASSAALTFLFAGLLLFAGAAGLAGYARTMRFGRKIGWIAGAVSGLLGGLVGNQGGIRSAALLGFGLERHAFVATATAIALIVDAARMPVYFATAGDQIVAAGGLTGIATAGVLAGTLAGARLLRRIPPRIFDRLVGGIVTALGVFMLWRATMQR